MTQVVQKERNRRVEELDAHYSGVIGNAHNGELHVRKFHIDMSRISHAGASQRPSGPLSSLCNPQHSAAHAAHALEHLNDI